MKYRAVTQSLLFLAVKQHQDAVNLTEAINVLREGAGGIPDPLWLPIDKVGKPEAPRQHGVLVNLYEGGGNRLYAFTGGRAGQMLTLRPFAGLTIVHSDDIRLNGAKSVGPSEGLDANKLIDLLCISGSGKPGSPCVWAEKSRNFAA